MSLPAIVRLRNYRHYPGKDSDGVLRVHWLDYSAPKDTVFVAVVLGIENKDGTDPLPLLAMLRLLVVDDEAVVP